jgi:hypothetical protein
MGDAVCISSFVEFLKNVRDGAVILVKTKNLTHAAEPVRFHSLQAGFPHMPRHCPNKRSDGTRDSTDTISNSCCCASCFFNTKPKCKRPPRKTGAFLETFVSRLKGPANDLDFSG